MLRRNSLALGGVASLLALTACSAAGGDTEAAADGERRSLSVAVVTEGLPFLPFYVGLSDGTFDEAGLDIDVTVSNSGPAVLQAVASRAVNIGGGQADSVAVSAAQDAPPSIGIAALYEGIPQNLVFRSGYLEEKGVAPEELADLSPAEELGLLEGARVATYGPAGLIDNVFSELADVGGIDPDSMTRITIPGAQPQIVAMGGDQVDAAILGSWPVLADSGDNHPVSGSPVGELSPLLATMPHEVMFVGESWREQNEDALRDFAQALTTACDNAREQPALELAEKIQAAGYLQGSPAEELAVGIEEVQSSIPVGCQFSPEALAGVEDFSVKHGVVPATLDWAPLYTNEYVQ